MKRNGLQTALAGILLSAALGLAGCSGGAKTAASEEMVYQETAAMSKGDYGLKDSARSLNAEVMEVQEAAGNEIAMEGASIPQMAPQAGRKLIKNIRLDMESTDFDTLIAGITDKVEQLGGYVESSNISGSSITNSNRYRNAYITARIPSDQLDAFVSAVSEQGNVTNQSGSTTDVTLQYTDMESRKKSLLVEQERLWELLEKAESLEGIIAIETRLSEIRYQLESYESQLRLFDNQVDYSTVELSINEVKIFTPTTPDSVMTRIQKGFMQNLNYLGEFFVSLFIFLAAYSPVILVIAVFIIAIWMILKKALKKQSRNPSTAPLKKGDELDGKNDAKEDKDHTT